MSGAGPAWHVQGCSVTGSGHRKRGVGCQDAHAVVHVGSALIVAVADGAGSAARADAGARRAVGAAVMAAAAWAPALAGRPHLAGEAGVRWMGVARGALGSRDMATTLAVAVATPEVVVTAQIGDGLVVVRDEGEWVLVDPPERGEYLNETVFLTSDRWEAAVRVTAIPASRVDAIAALSDGLQLVAVDLARDRPHAQFFEPVARHVATAGSDPRELVALLDSERMCARTDDDKTLVMAVRGGAAG